MNYVKAVIFDWAGTVVDHGSLAPMGAFVEAFAEFGVDISIAEARGPMGMAKRPHIAAILALPGSPQAWSEEHGRPATDADIDAVYDSFVPRNKSVAARYATLIDGAAETAGLLRAQGVRIGSTTGYTREIMAEITPSAARQGFSPDCLVCTGDTPDGRPTPFMLYRCLLDLEVWPAWAGDQGRRHGSRHRRGSERRRLDRRCRGQRQRLRAFAGRYAGASPPAVRTDAGRSREAPDGGGSPLRHRQRRRPASRGRPDRGAAGARRAALTGAAARLMRLLAKSWSLTAIMPKRLVAQLHPTGHVTCSFPRFPAGHLLDAKF